MESIRRPIVGLALALSLLLGITVPPVRAQYYYLDTNADGVHDATDVVSPSGTTTLDVWLVTNAGRSGAAVACPNASESLDLSGYDVILRATNGTVSWGAFQNRIASFTTAAGSGSNETDLRAGFSSGTPLPAGTYRVASVTVTVAGGTPGIRFGAATPLGNDAFTGFFSSCEGPSGDYTLVLDRDFTDADGVAYGGISNQAPTLAAIADMTALEGEVTEQTIAASDPESQPLSFAKASGPAYVTVSTTDPGTGSATGLVRVAPPPGNSEVRTASVAASDGFASDEKSFTVTVPIAITPIADVTVPAYGTAVRNLTITDPSGPGVTFTRVSGPSFARIRVVTARSAEISIEPGVNDAGAYQVTVHATDGVTATDRTFAVTVTELPPCAPGLCLARRAFASGDAPYDLAVADFNRDGNPDLVTVNRLSNTVGVLIGRGDGTFQDLRQVTVPGPLPSALAVGDLDEDGNPDVAVAESGDVYPEDSEGHSVTILFGAGDGTFPRQSEIPVEPAPWAIALGDFDEDGHPDLVVSHYYLFTGSSRDGMRLYRGRGDGTFGAGELIPYTWPAQDLVTLDLNGDGHLDLAYGTNFYYNRCVDALLGGGDGTFDSASRTASTPPRFAVPGYAYSVAAGDLNGDGFEDVVAGGFGLIGTTWIPTASIGYGAAAPPFPLAPSMPLDVASIYAPSAFPAVGDFSGDGRPDLLAAVEGTSGFVVGAFARRDGSFTTFRRVASGITYPRSMVAADFDHDGRLDFATVEYGFIYVHVFMNRGYAPIPATVTVSPTVLGGAGPSAVFRVWVELPPGYDVSAIDLATIRLDDTIAPDAKSGAIGDQDRDGIPDLTLTFPRSALATLPRGMHEFELTAETLEGDPIAGTCAARLVGPGGHGALALRVTSPLGATPVALATERPAAAHAIEVFDVRGRLVRRWTETAGADGLRASWDGRNADGGRAGSGVYFVRVKSGRDESVARAVIMR